LPLRLSGVASTLTLHDAMGIKPYPWDIGIARNARERFINRYWAYMTRTSALQAKRVITAAVGAQTEIQSVLPVPSERFAIVGHGIALAPPCQPKPRQAQTILAVASPDPRKNLAVLYAALSPQFAPVWNNNAPLLRVVGTSAKAAERAEEALKRNGIVRYEILRSPSDLELSNLYAESAVFVFPSLLEGFGLPPLEAMQRGCAVLASSAPVMPEVLGESAVYFDPHNAEELAGKLSGLLAQPNEMYERGKAGQGYAAQFTCKQMANKTANVWKAVLNA
jgi:glycosyltransferase involved in cell wall biosynthesis